MVQLWKGCKSNNAPARDGATEQKNGVEVIKNDKMPANEDGNDDEDDDWRGWSLVRSSSIAYSPPTFIWYQFSSNRLIGDNLSIEEEI